MISYNGLIRKMENENVKWKDLPLSGGTKQNIRLGKSINLDIIDRLCNYFECQPSELIEWIPGDNRENLKEIKKQKKIAELRKQLEALENI